MIDLEPAAGISALPTSLLIVFGVAAVVQVGLDVYALFDLYRRPIDRVTLGNKWIWVAVILLVNLLGAILYLAIGRRPAPAAEVAGSERRPTDQVDKAIDSLYGARRPDDRP